MARQQGTQVQNNFVGGLNTEFTELNYPENAATETFNCVFDYTGRVTRRPGFDFETNYVLQDTPLTSLSAFTEFTWNSAGGNGDVTFLVQQKGDTIYFYDVSSSVRLGENLKSFTVDLNDYLVTGSSKDPGTFPCQYTTVRGDLIIVNGACNPVAVSYAINTDGITKTEIRVKQRDFKGLSDGLATFERPTATVAGIKSSNPKHYYNLLNQGWHVGDALSQWDTARSDLPSNGDYVATFRASDSDSFENSYVTSKTGGNSPAPKGHFILEVGNVDRSTAMEQEGFTGVTINEGTINVTQAEGTAFGDFDDLSSAYDNSTSGTYSSVNSTDAYVGKDYSADSIAVKCNKATVYPPSVGFLETNDVTSVTFRLYGKTIGMPSSSTDGDLLGTTTLSGTSTAVTKALGTAIGNMNNSSNVFDSSNVTFATRTDTEGYVGKTWDTGKPATVTSVSITPVTGDNPPFVPSIGSSGVITCRLYGKTGNAPSSATDGTLLGTSTRTASGSTSTQSVTQSDGSNISLSTTNAANAFDTGATTTYANRALSSSYSLGQVGYVGKNYSSLGTSGGVKITGATVRYRYSDIPVAGSPSSPTGTKLGTFYLYGKTGSAPSSYNDGTLLDSAIATNSTATTVRTATFTTANTTHWDYVWISYVSTWASGVSGNTSSGYFRIYDLDITGTYEEDTTTWSTSPITITSSDTTTRWDHVWVRVSHNASSSLIKVGEVAFSGSYLAFSTSSVTITSSDTTTEFESLWVRMSSSTSGDSRISEIYFDATYPSLDSSGAEGTDEITTDRFSTVATFASRIWYSGIGSGANASTIYFTQVITSTTKYDECYQQQDPTSEYYSVLLPTDGGSITIPEVGIVRKLFTLKTALLVFSSNGVWVISGSNGRAFAANDYQVKKVSGLGSSSPLSFVDYKGYPMWFGEDGIFYVFFDPQYETYEVQSITDESIKSFFLSIPSRNRKYVKGAYNLNDDVITWIYNRSEDTTQSDNYVYNSMLSFSGRNKAFYPWTVDLTSGPIIRGINYVFDVENTDRPVLKYTTTFNKDVDEDYLTFSNCDNTVTYLDWQKYADDITSDATDAKDYESYFITGYRPDGEYMRPFQINYLTVFLEAQANASCKVQAIYDYSNSSSSGKQSMFQEAYNDNVLNRRVNYRRLRIRGHGKTVQLKFKSSTGKPFTVLGWAAYETGNANV